MMGRRFRFGELSPYSAEPMGNYRSKIERLWSSSRSTIDSLAWGTLVAASLPYRGVIAVRERWWQAMADDPPLPVVSVGNLTIGGSAKTPFTLFLAHKLQARSYRVGIVSRGYGRASSGDAAVLVADKRHLFADISTAGDEPFMMAHYFNGPIAVARRRIDAIRLLASRFPLDLILLDDGFQHLRLRRTIDLALVDAHSGFGNGWILPAGPMREPIGALRRASLVVITGLDEPDLTTSQLQNYLKENVRPVLHADIRPAGLITSVGSSSTQPPQLLNRQRVLAFSGIAGPRKFLETLQRLGADIIGHLEYSDHHVYTQRDWEDIRAAANRADLVVTTEKDLVKLDSLLPALPRLFALKLEVAMRDNEEDYLLDLISSRIPIEPEGREPNRALAVDH